jgi:hypothetical protein
LFLLKYYMKHIKWHCIELTIATLISKPISSACTTISETFICTSSSILTWIRDTVWFICTMYYITSDIADCIPWFICTMYYITSDIADCIPWFICTMYYITSDIVDCIPWFICTMNYMTSDIADCIPWFICTREDNHSVKTN